MEFWQTILLAIIQGITEWLPVSSSGHLVLFQEFFNIKASILFDISLHLGSLFALLLVFRKDIKKIILSFFNKDREQQKLAYLIIIATFFTVLVVLIFKKTLSNLFQNTLAVGIALIITGLLLMATKFVKKQKKNISLKDSILIGTIQGIAFIPGISRSGSTISTALLRNISKEQATRFSFLLFIPAVIGAFIFQINQEQIKLDSLLLIATIISFIVSYITIKVLLRIIIKGKFHYFAYYCFVLGIIAILLSI